MRMIKGMGALLAALLVAACGGGGGSAGAPPFGDGGGSGGGSAPTADLIVELSKANVANTGSDSVIITTTALDAARNTITGAPVQVTADAEAIVTSTTATTGADGKQQSTLTIGSNRSNRIITVTVQSGSVTKTASVQVFGAKVTATLVPAVVAPGAAGKIQYRLTDQAGSPMVGQEVVVTASGFTPAEATGTTGVNGDYEFSYTAPAAPGSYTVTANAGGTSDEQTISVQAASSVPAPTGVITSASVSANPSVVGTNLVSSTSNRSEVRALFLAAGNVPVRNVRVRFDLAGDANAIGGSFTTGSEILYSDVNGVVTSAYVPATRSSPTDGVTIRACYASSDALLGTAAAPLCPNSVTTSLTVTSEPLGISIGTNELIIVNELTYAKKYIVSVVDSAGRAKADVDLVVSLDLTNYRKGAYALLGDEWVKINDPLVPTFGDRAVCANEDTNRNGVLEVGEDVDNDGRLDPGKSDVSVSLLHAKTRADGTAELQILYAKSFGSWVDAKITVAASGVSGTEGRAIAVVAPVPVDAASIGNAEVPPAYQVSPYGTAPSCTNPN
jgi:hypothetical protein